MNSPINPHSHSPCISGSTALVGKTVARGTNKNPQVNTLYSEPLARLIGRANEEQILVNRKSVTALLDTRSQVTCIIHDYCQAKGIPINPISQLVHIEGTGGHTIEYGYGCFSFCLLICSFSDSLKQRLILKAKTSFPQFLT